LIRGGTGGANTNKTGLEFEHKTKLEDALREASFQVKEFKVYRDNLKVAELAGKNRLYKFLEENYDGWENPLSAKLWPDEALVVDKSGRLNIIEKKWQQVSGTVDEKLQTCGFKIRQYGRLIDGTGLELKYIYLLNDWFAHPKYDDVRKYILDTGASYHFYSVPLEELDLA
jgi:hypothetical protein